MIILFINSKSKGMTMSHFIILLICILYTGVDRALHVDARTVRPVPSKRLPFLGSRNSRKAAKEAYAAHLENELKETRRQLYTSQNTCTSLRKRCEDQRKETLRMMSSASSAEREEDKEQLMQQRKEIESLQMKLQRETQLFQEQVEKLALLEEEMEEVKKMKVQSNEAEMKEYEEKLLQSRQKEIEYEEEIELLTLKLEAAKLAAQQQREGEEDPSITLRAEELQATLEKVREKYLAVLNTAKDGGYDEDYQKEIETEMEQSIQVTLEKTLKAIEEEWETRYAEVEKQLTEMSDHVKSLKSERDAVLGQLEASVSSSSVSELNEEQLKDELAQELTESLTQELTEQLTEQLTAELKAKLTKKIERKYKKKYKQMQQELDEQKATSEQSQSSADFNEEQRQKIDEEIAAAREQCELEYKAKLTELQKQSDERVQIEKERMRKLVRALLEREAKQKSKAEAAEATKKSVKKKKQSVSNGSEGKGDDEIIKSSASLSSSRKKKSRKGIPRPSSF